MLKFILGLFLGITLTSIPIYKLKEKVGHLEQTFISCFQYKGMYVNGELHLCHPKNTYLKKEQFHEFYSK